MDLNAIERRLRPCGLSVLKIDETRNPPVEANQVPLTWQDLNHPQLGRMVRDYRLDEVVAGARDELEQLLLLRNWVFVNVPRGTPEWTPDQPWLLADLARNGRGFYCSHYADVLTYAVTALGWLARHIGIDCDHAKGELSTHHGVTEVFSYALDRWLVLDAMFDVHFERKGLPLCADEIRRALENGHIRQIGRMVGPRRRRTATRRDVAPAGFDHAGCYFWFHVPTRNNDFSQPRWQGNDQSLLLIDDSNRHKTWYQNRYDEKGRFLGSRLHSGLRTGGFLKTERVADLYPTMGRTHINIDLTLPRPKDSPVLPVVLHTINPHWQGFEVKFDQATPWVPVGRHVDWRLHAGMNILEARLVTQSGRTGVPARVDLVVRRSAPVKSRRHGGLA